MIDFSALVCLVTGLAQIWKKLGLPTRFIPLLNIVIGVIFSFLWFHELGVEFRLKQGLILGLSASGGYDVYMALKKK